MRKWILIGVGVVLSILFVLLTPPPSKQTETSTTTLTAAPTTSVQKTSQTSATTTTTPAQVTPTTTQRQETAINTNATKTQTTSKETTTLRGPRLNVEFNMPTKLNTSRLPIEVSYGIVLTNTGDQDTYVYMNDEIVAVPAGRTVVINKTLTIAAAGSYAVKVTLPNGTQITHRLSVFYFTPRLEARPVEIEVNELPTQLIINVTLLNTGNYTAHLNNMEVKPGEAAMIKIPLHISTAGTHYVEIDGIRIPVTVVYRRTLVVAEILTTEIEALPGEEVEIPIAFKNIGNATAEVQIAGEKISIDPNASRIYRYRLKAEKSGPHIIEFSIGKTIYRQKVTIKIITVNVLFYIEKPLRDALRPGTTATIELTNRHAQIAWRPAIYTNAASRIVSVEVDGRVFQIKPRQEIELDTRVIDVQVPGKAHLQIAVNNTIYTATIELRPKPPTVQIRDISKIEVKDSRAVYALKISCTRPIQKDFRVDILGVDIYVEFGAETTFSGTITIEGEARGRATLRGRVAGGEGWANFSNIYIPAIGGAVAVNVKFRTNPLQILEAKIPNAPVEVQCAYPLELIPKYLDKITGTYRLDVLAVTLVNMLAKSSTDYVNIYRSVEYDGEKITLYDNAGRRITVALGERRIEITGEGLTAKIHAEYITS